MLVCNKLLIWCTECFPLSHQENCLPASTTSCNTEEDILYTLYKPKAGFRTPFPKWSDKQHQRRRNSKKKGGGRRILIYNGFLCTINEKNKNLLCFYDSGYKFMPETVAPSTQRSSFSLLDKAF